MLLFEAQSSALASAARLVVAVLPGGVLLSLEALDRRERRRIGLLDRCPQPHLGRGLVHQVDRLVGQRAVLDVALGQPHRGLAAPPPDVKLVVLLVALRADRAGSGAPRPASARRRRSGQSGARGPGRFSMRSRYSSRVVAPMQRSSPRASAGLSMLEASTRPSALPAPTSVCSSSMNRITVALGGLHLVDDRLDALLELAAELRRRRSASPCPGRSYACLRSGSGTSPRGDQPRQTFDDGRLADAGLADQDRVVLGAADRAPPSGAGSRPRDR